MDIRFRQAERDPSGDAPRRSEPARPFIADEPGRPLELQGVAAGGARGPPAPLRTLAVRTLVLVLRPRSDPGGDRRIAPRVPGETTMSSPYRRPLVRQSWSRVVGKRAVRDNRKRLPLRPLLRTSSDERGASAQLVAAYGDPDSAGVCSDACRQVWQRDAHHVFCRRVDPPKRTVSWRRGPDIAVAGCDVPDT